MKTSHRMDRVSMESQRRPNTCVLLDKTIGWRTEYFPKNADTNL